MSVQIAIHGERKPFAKGVNDRLVSLLAIPLVVVVVLVDTVCCEIARGRGDRTSDLYRVNFEVNDLKPFPYLAFPHSKGPKISSKLRSFDGELMASFPDLARSMSVIDSMTMSAPVPE
jgi:hypothetical protein